MQSNDDSGNVSRCRTLAAEVDTAAAMMALAKISSDGETVRRNRANALRSYKAAMDLFLLTRMSYAQEQEMWDRIAPIREWLEAAALLKR
jgi:hypothetical protein